MKLSIVLDQLGTVRDRAVAMVRELGVAVGDDEEVIIKLVVGEATTNCIEHGGCEVADLSAFVQNGDVVIAITASCYDNQEEAESWLQTDSKDAVKRDCIKVDELQEGGRGVHVMNSLTKGIEIHEGTMYFTLNFATERALVAA